MSPEAVLGPALAEAVRELVRREMEARPAAPVSAVRRTLTVPEASKATGVSVETIRGLIHGGRIPVRLAGANPNPKRRTFLVYAEEVLTALDRPVARATEPVDFQEKAARLRARVERRGE
jgi:excisionase family DNA binding protein